MKRRTFIGGILAVCSLAQIASAELPNHNDSLFRRFFTTATGFSPSPQQLKWHEEYTNGELDFSGLRQTGMTTFMLVLCEFIRKTKGESVAVMLYFGARLNITKRLNEMESRLGRSVKDGSLTVCYVNEDYIVGHQNIFIMNDGNFDFRRNTKLNNDKTYTFKTYENYSN